MTRKRRDGPIDLARHRRARRGRGGRWLRRAGLWVLILAAVAGPAAAAAGLRVREVRIVGLRQLSPNLVARVAAVQGGERILLTRFDRVTLRVESLPGVRQAHVERSLPFTLVVHVLERVPLARLDGHPELTADADGRLFQAPAQQLPVLIGWRGKPAEGRSLDAKTGDFLKGFEGFPSTLRSRASRIETGKAVTMTLNDGVRVLFGRPDLLAAKAAAALAVIEDAAKRGMRLDYVDVRAPRTPVVGQRAPAPTPSAAVRRTSPVPSAAVKKTSPAPSASRKPSASPTPRPH